VQQARLSRGGAPNTNEGRRQKGIAPRVEKLNESIPNPPARNAYATTPAGKPGTPRRNSLRQKTHGDAHKVVCQTRLDSCHGLTACHGLNSNAINRRLEITKTRWEK